MMRLAIGFGALSALAVLTWPAVVTAADMRGVTSTEIKIGQTMPYSGPVSAFGALGKGEVGYFKMLNERGGINGRKINLISLDDGYAPANNPNAKFAVISQTDDFGRDYLLGLKDVLGEKYDSVVTAATYEIQDPTIDSQIVKLKASGADVFVIAATPKFAAQSIRKAFEIGWRPMTFLSNVAVWVSTVMEPAGLEAGVGILSTAYVKDPDDPAWKDDPGVKGWREFMIKYVPDADLHDTNYVNSYNSAMVLESVLKACGDDLSTENILKQAYAIKDLELPMLLPGIKVNTSPSDHVPVDQMQFMRFNGKSWERFGELLTGN